MAPRKIDEGVREKVREAHGKGLSRKKIAEQFGISPTSVGRIIKEGKGEKPEPKAPRPKAEPASEKQKKIDEIERRIMALERKILYYESKKKGLRS